MAQAGEMENKVKQVRQLLRAGKEEAAWALMEDMTKDVGPLISRRLNHWAYNVSNREDARSEIHLNFFTEWMSLDAYQSWETFFWNNAKTNITNILGKYNRTVKFQKELQMSRPREDEKGVPVEWHEDVADSNVNDVQDVIDADFAKEALAMLTTQEREVLILCRVHDCTQKQAAEKMGVTDRTIRNLATRAQAKIESLLASA